MNPTMLNHDDFALRHLRLPADTIAACAAAGVRTVAHVATDRARPAEVPDAMWAEVVRRAEAFRQTPLPPLGPVDVDRPLPTLVSARRALRAFDACGLRTVGEFLACPKRELLAVPGFGQGSWNDVARRIRAAAAQVAPSIDLEWLPKPWLETRIEDLALPQAVRETLLASPARDVADLLRGRGPDDAAARHAVRHCLWTALQVRMAGPDAGESFPTLLRRLRATLDEGDRRLLDAVLGVGRRPTSPARAGAQLRIPILELDQRIAALRRAVRAAGQDVLELLGRDAEADLAVHEGILGVEDLAFGSRLRSAALAAPDPDLPLRLLAFTAPDRWCYEGDRLCGVPAEVLRQIARALRSALRRASTPVPVSSLASAVADVVPAGRTGVLLHVLRRSLGLSVRLNPEHGEIVVRRSSSLTTRLESLLEESDAPVAVEDLLFRYRDRHGRASRRRLLDALRSAGAFLEVAPHLWSLRARHVDELELLRPEAERIASEIRATGQRHSLRDGVRRGELSERSAFLLTDLLRREPGLRPLGRGEFASRAHTGSNLVAELVAGFRRAMGEVPFARFLQNQPAGRRRVVARILRHNRLFVAPARDRIDLLENYPFTGDRLKMLLRAVETCVAESDGYASMRRVHAAVDAAELGGSFLTDELLVDILRRHGEFEFLPGGWIAAPGVGLGRWIQRTARDILRNQDLALTPEQILAERPELAEFGDCLAELLGQDPLVHSEDGLHYQIV